MQASSEAQYEVTEYRPGHPSLCEVVVWTRGNYETAMREAKEVSDNLEAQGFPAARVSDSTARTIRYRTENSDGDVRYITIKQVSGD
jgi:hypothetical protein